MAESVSVNPPPVNSPVVNLKTGVMELPWRQYIDQLTTTVNGLSSGFAGGVLQLDAGGTGVATLSGTTGSATSKLVFSGKPTFDSTIGVGGATAAASGAGVSFPATVSPSTDPNTLDDYEEGTWTPSVGGSATYTTQTGTYTKVGRLVTIKLRIVINVIGTGSTSTISGLPFTVGDTNSAAIGAFDTLALSVVWLGAYLPVTTTTIVLTGTTAAAASVTEPIAAIGSGTALRLTAQYTV